MPNKQTIVALIVPVLLATIILVGALLSRDQLVQAVVFLGLISWVIYFLIVYVVMRFTSTASWVQITTSWLLPLFPLAILIAASGGSGRSGSAFDFPVAVVWAAPGYMTVKLLNIPLEVAREKKQADSLKELCQRPLADLIKDPAYPMRALDFAVASDGSLVVLAQWHDYQVMRLIRIKPDGQLDLQFRPPLDCDGTRLGVSNLQLGPHDEIFVKPWDISGNTSPATLYLFDSQGALRKRLVVAVGYTHIDHIFLGRDGQFYGLYKESPGEGKPTSLICLDEIKDNVKIPLIEVSRSLPELGDFQVSDIGYSRTGQLILRIFPEHEKARTSNFVVDIANKRLTPAPPTAGAPVSDGRIAVFGGQPYFWTANEKPDPARSAAFARTTANLEVTMVKEQPDHSLLVYGVLRSGSWPTGAWGDFVLTRLSPQAVPDMGFVLKSPR